MNIPRFVYFGTPRFAAVVLDELERSGFVPQLVVAAPERPKGRGLVLTPCETKKWATERHIPVLTPETIRDNTELRDALTKTNPDLFVVAAYGKIIPKSILDIPKKGALNVHPSLLPKFRGASPVESAILSDESETGVTIMLLDDQMDHGPILTQQKGIPLEPRPRGSELTERMAHSGGDLLARTIPGWLSGVIIPYPQDHRQATRTEKIEKKDGLIDISGDPVRAFKKIRAFDEWPGAYFFTEHNGVNIRVRITNAEMKNGTLCITSVIPAGKREMSYDDFRRGIFEAQ